MRGGYTIIELLVSMALFAVVVLMATMAFLGVMSSNRKTLASRTALDNLNFAIENMVRDMKTGYTYHCGNSGTITDPQDCPSPRSYIAFEGQNGNPLIPGDQIVYRLGGVGGQQIEVSNNSGSTFFPITAPPPELSVTSLGFRVYNALVSDQKQPRVVIVIRGVAGTGATASAFDVQTSVSQRSPDVE